MRKSFKDSLKSLESDIQHANTLASDYYPREYDGGCLQMRLSYSPTAHFFFFFIQWSDCNLAGTLGLLTILIYKAYEDGKTTISLQERKASVKEFYGVIYPSLLHFQREITVTEIEGLKQNQQIDEGKVSESEVDMEREEECGICLEMNAMVVLPDCTHSLCIKCYRSWHARSQSCPFCRGSLERVNSGDLWIYVSVCEIFDFHAIARENLKILLVYIEKLPHIGSGQSCCFL